MGLIYRLDFDTLDFYIGQTTRTLEERVKQHKYNRGKGSPLLQYAFENGELISYSIVEETSNLNEREEYWIETLKPTLNTTKGGKSNAGLSSPALKYSEQQIKDIVYYFLETNLPYTEISNLTKVKYGTVQDICKRRSHAWAWQDIPEEQFIEATKLRSLPKVKVYDMDNNLFEGESIPAVAEMMNKPYHIVYSAILGKTSREGISVVKHSMVQLTDPNSEQFIITLARAIDFLKDTDLSPFQLSQLTKKFKSSGGWKIKILDDNTIA